MERKAEVRKGWCGPCHTRCGLLVEFDGEKAVKVRGNPDYPVNRGAMCGRGQLILEHLYHPDRLNYPLKRSGKPCLRRVVSASLWARSPIRRRAPFQTFPIRSGLRT